MFNTRNKSGISAHPGIILYIDGIVTAHLPILPNVWHLLAMVLNPPISHPKTCVGGCLYGQYGGKPAQVTRL
jgi:hypothetical protein